MKRHASAICTLVLILSVLCILPVSADGDITTWNSIRPKPLYIQDGMRLTSTVNPDFAAAWPLFPIAEAGKDATCTVNMRGFALSPNGRYAYLGIQHGGGDVVRGLFVMETMTGRITDFAYRYDGDTCASGVPYSYPKGIAADARGYVYVGYTLSSSYNAAYLAIYRQNSDGTLEKLTELPVCDLGEPGGPFGIKVGINGVAVRELDGKTYCYVVTNYDHDTLVRIDVTDPQKPLLDNAFGKSGVVNLAPDALNLRGYTLDEAQYLDIASDGTIYLCINATDGRDGIAELSPDGKTSRRVIEQDGAYSILIYESFLLCGTRTGGQVAVIVRETGKSAGTLSVLDQYGERVTRLQVADDVLFICDAGSLEGIANAIYAAPLSDGGQTYLDAIVTAQNTGKTDWYTETEPTTGTPIVPDTEPDTNATTSPQDTESPTEAPTTPLSPPPAPPAVGCTSSIAGTGLVLLLGAAYLFVRKNH